MKHVLLKQTTRREQAEQQEAAIAHNDDVLEDAGTAAMEDGSRGPLVILTRRSCQERENECRRTAGFFWEWTTHKQRSKRENDLLSRIGKKPGGRHAGGCEGEHGHDN